MEELVKRAKSGDKSAAGEIIKKFNYFVIKQAGKYQIPSYSFEDLVQHGYLSVIKSIHLYKEGKSSFTTYCTNAVVNNFNTLLKGQIKHYREIQDEGVLNSQVYDFSLEDEIIAYEETEKISQAIEMLEGEEQRVIKRIYIEDKTLKAVAKELNICYRKAIYVKKDAFEKLKKYLE